MVLSSPKAINPEINTKFKITFPKIRALTNLNFLFENTLDTSVPTVYPEKMNKIIGAIVSIGFAVSAISIINGIC